MDGEIVGMKCAQCQWVMKEHSLGAFAIVSSYAWYCENTECPRVYLLAVGGFPIRKAANVNPTEAEPPAGGKG